MCAIRSRRIALAVFMLAWTMALPDLSQAGEAQPIGVHADLKVGAEWKYELSFDLLVSEEGESAPVVGRIVQSANLTLTVDRETPDGSFILKGTFDRLTSIWRRGDNQYEFSWVRNDEQVADENQNQPAEEPVEAVLNPLQGKAPALDDAAIFQSVFDVLVDREFTIVVAGDGRVMRVGGFGVVGRLSEAEDLDETAVGVFLPPRFGEAIEPIWRPAGAHTVEQIGDAWSQSRKVRFGRAGGIDISAAWHVAGLDRESLSCEGVISATAIAPESPSPTQPTLEVVRGQGEASFTWSLTDRALIEREERLDLALRWTLGDLKRELHQLSTQRLRQLP